MQEIILILDNIRSTHNVGSIFRTADAVGVSKIYCIGTTPTPIDRFGRKRKDIAKASLGAEDTVAWEYFEQGVEVVELLKKQGFSIVALEQHEKSIDYRTLIIAKNSKQAIVVGNEVEGVSKDILDCADQIVEIPMKGKKESLNVSVATGVLLFQISK